MRRQPEQFFAFMAILFLCFNWSVVSDMVMVSAPDRAR